MSDDAAATAVSEPPDDPPAAPSQEATDRAPDVATASRPRRRRVRLLVGALVVVLLLALPLLVVQGVGRAHERALADVPDHTVALVLGAGLHPDGTPSTYLARRLDAAKTLYDQGTVKVILVSGDNSTVTHDEPTAMRDYLVEHGVPSNAIVLDYAGFDTHDSCVRAHKIFGIDDAVVISQGYHVPRAAFSCTAAGIDTTGVGVSASSVTPTQAVLWRVREIPASYKAAWDALVGRDPVHLGERETGVQDALDRG